MLQRHTPTAPPQGSVLASFTFGKNAQLPVYWTENANNQSSTHVLIVIHGSLRDGDSYWAALNGIKEQQLAWGNENVDPNLIITAPMFYSTRFNSGLYTAQQLTWGDLNLWQMGAPSNHPNNTRISSFTAVSELIEHFSQRKLYPNMKNITLIGHSGGAQFVNRYASVVPTEPKHVHVRYLVADPSSSMYFTPHRPITDPSYVNITNCTTFNDWRYGVHKFDITPYSGKSGKYYFRTYTRRDVINLNGLLDTELNGDQQCMALAQGGSQRIGRNLAWWKYINLLGGTDEDVSLFPGNFSDMPDWGNMINDQFNVKLSVVANATHDVTEVFSSPQGVSAMFDSSDINFGWRPTEAFPIPPVNSTEPQAGSTSDPNGSLANASSAKARPAAFFLVAALGVVTTLFLTLWC